MNKILKIIFILSLMNMVISCSNSTNNIETPATVKGNLLVWHTWKDAERVALKEILDNFKESYPDVSIVEESYPQNQINKLFEYQVNAGLGPDILIAPADWAEPFAKKGLIRDIGAKEVNTEVYLPNAMTMLEHDGKLYGLPLSLNTMILYYNKNLLNKPLSGGGNITANVPKMTAPVTNSQSITAAGNITASQQATPTPQPIIEEITPAADLDMLLAQLDKGHKIAVPSDFYGAFWGVQAFGGTLFDKEGRVILNQGGFANWLGWLKQAQNNPNVILNRNRDDLRTLFRTGRATYYIGSTQELSALRAALGEEVVGAIRLPGRQSKFAGPFLQTEALMFNQVSSNNSFNLALRLAQYFGNNEQQRRLALNIGKLPANKQVSIDPRISAIVAEFIAQSKTAVPIKLNELAKVQDIIAQGDDVYGRVLDGDISVGQAATLLTRDTNKKYALETITTSYADNCKAKGNLILWNTWTDKKSEALAKIKEVFSQKCPDVSLQLVEVSAIEFEEKYAKAIEEGNPPDLFTGNSNQIRNLAPVAQILELSKLIHSDFLQRVMPTVEKTIRYSDKPYMIPTNINLMALYYNKKLVESPPVALDDLLTLASPETPVALPIGFQESYWGLAAFGESVNSTLFDEEKRLVIGQFGLNEWLIWLKEAQSQSGFTLSRNKADLQSMFIEGKVAMLVGDSSQLAGLQQVLTETVGITQLPSGSPILDVDGFFISPYSDPKKQQTAVMFAQFMTDIDSQVTLIEQATQIPVNINVNVADYPAIQVFFEQANTAQVVPNQPEVNSVYKWGNLVYDQVLENNIEPVRALADFKNLVDITNGFETVDNTIQDCTDEGTVNLWESWSEAEQVAWQQVISDFAKICPTIQIKTTFVAKNELTLQLTQTLEAVAIVTPTVTFATPITTETRERPDFFIASHAELESYQKMGLVRDMSSFLSTEELIDYLPKAVNAMSFNETIYGIPQSLDVAVLYYHIDQTLKPAKTFPELLDEAKKGHKIALNPTFYHILWGAAAFGCEPCALGQFFNDQSEVQLNPTQVTSWTTWLEIMRQTQTLSQTPAVIFNSDQQALQQLFLNHEVTYLVAGADFLHEAKTKLGVANVGVAILPFGENETASRPFLSVNGFLFYQGATDEQIKLALKFAQFAASRKNQTQLIKTANLIPTNNLALITVNDATLQTFISALDYAMLLPETSKRTLLEESPVFKVFDNLFSPVK